MYNLAVLQARVTSSRLPRKVLMTVNGKELLAYQCERILLSKKINKLVIATSVDSSDDDIELLSKRMGISCYRGPLDNVLERYYHTAKQFYVEDMNVIRLTGDCPVIDHRIIDEIIGYFEQNELDYYSNTLQPTYPDGMDTEVFTFNALEQAFNNATYKSDREHVTLYIKNNDQFKKGNHFFVADFSHLRLTVDEPNDYTLIKTLIEKLYPLKKDFSMLDIISLLTRDPQLLTINNSIMRDEGLAKSLREDGRIH